MSELKFIVYDVQHGSCSHVITPANQHIIIDLGSKAETSICRYLKENYFRYGGTIDQLVLTHLHEDHIYDLPNLDTYGINPCILQRPRGAFPLSYKASDPNHYKRIVNKANELNEHYTGVVSDSESPVLFQNNGGVHSSHSQVYSTNNYGHLLGFISSNGNYTVVPSRFCEIQTAARSLSATIECTYSQNGEEKSVPNGSKLSVGGKLYFKLKTAGGIIDPIEKVRVVWEVSNGGIGTHSSHQEIYFKGRAEDNNMFTFSRDLSYYGTHLLRCKISNARKGTITRIFKVVGV